MVAYPSVAYCTAGVNQIVISGWAVSLAHNMSGVFSK